MKKLLLVVLFNFFTSMVYSQNGTQDKTIYLSKSSKQTKRGWIVFGSGAALLATGLIIPKGDYTHTTLIPTIEHYENDDIKYGLGIAGVAAMAASVPFFISAAKNKKKASGLVSLHLQKNDALRNTSSARISIPVLTVKLFL